MIADDSIFGVWIVLRSLVTRSPSRLLKNSLSVRRLKKVQMLGGAQRAGHPS
jgi:hypothetical protein